jgi:hypothetical protein
MALLSGQVTVSTSAVLIHRADGDGSVVIVHNDGGGAGHTVYLGPTGVTVSTGLHLSGTESREQVRLDAGEALYAIALNTVSVSFLAFHG